MVPHVVCFLLGDSLASELYMPTFRNTPSVPSSQADRCAPTCLGRGNRQECSETSAYKIQTSGNYPEESIQHSEHGESMKSRMVPHIYKSTHSVTCNRDIFDTLYPKGDGVL